MERIKIIRKIIHDLDKKYISEVEELRVMYEDLDYEKFSNNLLNEKINKLKKKKENKKNFPGYSAVFGIVKSFIIEIGARVAGNVFEKYRIKKPVKTSDGQTIENLENKLNKSNKKILETYDKINEKETSLKACRNEISQAKAEEKSILEIINPTYKEQTEIPKINEKQKTFK